MCHGRHASKPGIVMAETTVIRPNHRAPCDGGAEKLLLARVSAQSTQQNLVILKEAKRSLVLRSEAEVSARSAPSSGTHLRASYRVLTTTLAVVINCPTCRCVCSATCTSNPPSETVNLSRPTNLSASNSHPAKAATRDRTRSISSLKPGSPPRSVSSLRRASICASLSPYPSA